MTSLTGPNLGHDLVINIEQSKYMTGGVTPSAGARIVVHGASGRPLPDEMGHQLQPNTITALAIEEVYTMGFNTFEIHLTLHFF